MTKEDRAKNVLTIYQQADKDSFRVYWTKAKCLSLFRSEELWKLLFDGEGTWGEFCDQLRVPISSAQQKIAVWQFYIDKLKFTVEELLEKDTSCLYALARVQPDAPKATIKGFIDLISTVPRSEFLESLKGKCPHSKTKEVKVVREVCLKCKRKVKEIQ